MTTQTANDIQIARSGDGAYVLQTATIVRRPRREVFRFFADPENLERITPPLLRFRIETPLPIRMRAGTVIDYRIRVHGLPIRWRSEITDWSPDVRFVDEQRRGPYRRWVHEHLFRDHDQGTLVEDRVTYQPRGGAVAHALFVRRDLRRIFEFRAQSLARLLPDA